MSELKLCVYCDHWQNGGVEAYLMNLFRYGGKETERCTLVTADKTTDIYDEELRRLNVEHVVLLKRLYPSPVKRILHTFGAFRRHIGRCPYDAIYFNLTNSVTLRYALLAKRVGVKRRIVHSHCSDVRSGRTRLIKMLGAAMGRLLYASTATDYWACSERAAAWLFPRRYAQRIKIVPNAIQAAEYRFDPDIRKATRAKLGMDDNLIIGTVGRCVTEKNQAFLLRAFSGVRQKMPGSRLLLVGDGEQRTALEALARELKIDDACLFYGFCDKVAPLYNAMDVFCLTSEFEGLALVAIEAQAAGCHCLLANTVPPSAKITPNVTFLPIDVGTQKWTDAILSCAGQCEHQDTYKDVCAAGFDAETAFNGIWNMLNRLRP